MVARFACAGGRMAFRPQHRQSERDRRGEILGELLDAERRALLRQARSHTQRPQDAEDALSEACVQFLRFYDGPAGRDALRWMLLVIKRCAWEISRGGRSRLAIVAGGRRDVAPFVREERRGPAELVERLEETGQVAELIEALKPAERQALILLGLGYSYKEIARMRGWSRRKVDRCVYEGRAALRRQMGKGG